MLSLQSTPVGPGMMQKQLRIVDLLPVCGLSARTKLEVDIEDR